PGTRGGSPRPSSRQKGVGEEQGLIVEGGASREAATRSGGAERAVVVVLGIEDASDSPLAGLLDRAGAKRLPASPATQDGRGAARAGDRASELSRLNDEVLAAAGSAWDDVLRIPPERFAAAEVAELRVRAVSLLAADRLEDPSTFVLADLRSSRLVPFWAEAIEAAGAEPRFALVLRDPREAAGLPG